MVNNNRRIYWIVIFIQIHKSYFYSDGFQSPSVRISYNLQYEAFGIMNPDFLPFVNEIAIKMTREAKLLCWNRIKPNRELLRAHKITISVYLSQKNNTIKQYNEMFSNLFKLA